jgi:hypothetical protein
MFCQIRSELEVIAIPWEKNEDGTVRVLYKIYSTSLNVTLQKNPTKTV